MCDDSTVWDNMESIMVPGGPSLVSMSFSTPTCSANVGTSVGLLCSPTFFTGFSTCRRTFSLVTWGRWQRYCTTHLITQEDRRLGPIRERAEARRKCTLQPPPGLVPSWEHECCSHDNLSRWLLIQTAKSHKHSCKSSQQIVSLQTVGDTYYMDTIHSQSIKVQKETISG